MAMAVSNGVTVAALIATSVSLFGCDSSASCSSSDETKLTDPTVAMNFETCLNDCMGDAACGQACVDEIGLSEACLNCISKLDPTAPDVSKCGLHLQASAFGANSAGTNVFAKVFKDQGFSKGPVEAQNVSTVDTKSLGDEALNRGKACSSRDEAKFSDPTTMMNWAACMDKCDLDADCERACVDLLGLRASCINCLSKLDPATAGEDDILKCGLHPQKYTPTVGPSYTGNNMFAKVFADQSFSKGPVELEDATVNLVV